MNEFPYFSPDSHGLNVGIATVTKNVNAAIIFNHLFFWFKQNKAKGINQIEGRTWMYDSVADIAVQFPYLSERQIRIAIDSLIEHGYLIKGRHSDDKMDHRNWYALVNEGWIEGQKEITICPVRQIVSTPTSNRLDPDVKSIHKDTNIKHTDIKTEREARATPKKEKKETASKIPFGTYVELREGSYEKLCAELGKENVDYYIQVIDNHIPNAPKPYSDYEAAIRKWHLMDKNGNRLPKFTPSTLPPSSPGGALPVSDLMQENKDWFKFVHLKNHTLFYETHEYVQVRGTEQDSERIYFKEIDFKKKLIDQIRKLE